MATQILRRFGDGVRTAYDIPVGRVLVVNVNGGGAAYTLPQPFTVNITTPPPLGQAVDITVDTEAIQPMPVTDTQPSARKSGLFTTGYVVNTEQTIAPAALMMRQELQTIIVANTGAAVMTVEFRDTTAGAVIFAVQAPANSTVYLDFTSGWMATSQNTNWTAKVTTATPTISIGCQSNFVAV